MQKGITAISVPVIIVAQVPCCRMADNLPVVSWLYEHRVIPEALSHMIKANGNKEVLSRLEYFKCIPVLKETMPPLTSVSAYSLFPVPSLMQGS